MEKEERNQDIFISGIRREYGIKDTNTQEIVNDIGKSMFLGTFLIFTLIFLIILVKPK